MIKQLCFFSIFLIYFSCEHKQQQLGQRGVYFWRSSDKAFSEFETHFIQEQQIKKIYVKAFEVDFDENNKIAPVSKNLISLSNSQIDVLYVPTIFVNHSVFKSISSLGIDSLAASVVAFLRTMDFGSKDDQTDKFNIDEIQLDCDWTSKTKDAYFEFIKAVKSYSGSKISCTLRLYPYKYPNLMGIPPADRVMLMCYNLLEPLKSPQKNTILDISELKSYLNKSNEYPLPIDIALPLYSWIQIYQYGKFKGLSYNMQILSTDSLRKVDTLWYEVVQDCYVGSLFVRPGDRLKVEIIDQKTIEQAIDLLLKNIDLSHSTICFFHLDEQQLNRFTKHEISNFYSRIMAQ